MYEIAWPGRMYVERFETHDGGLIQLNLMKGIQLMPFVGHNGRRPHSIFAERSHIRCDR